MDKIYHISDTHIRLVSRQKEYKEVFNKLYKYLQEEKNEHPESIIVLTGDVIHTKTELSPEMVDIVSDFLNNLANIMPVILITGNHDANINNKNRMDSLTPIINNLNNKNIHYYRDTGQYNYNDEIIFYVPSIFNEDFKTANSLENAKDKKKILLYHGIVDGAKIDTGYKFEDNNFNVFMFGGYDMVLLGDIHKPQTLQYKDKNKPEVSYAGSLIGQNFGESCNNHGIRKWDIDSGISDFIEIGNKYGYITLNVENGKILNDEYIPPKPRIRLKVSNTAVEDLLNIKKRLRKNYSVKEIIVNNIVDENENAENSFDKTIIENINNASYQNELIEEFLYNKNFTEDKKKIEKVKKLNKRYNKELKYSPDIFYNINWKPIKLEFRNMFSYRGKHTMDFNKLKNLIGIFGENRSGKSSIVDILLFCLTDKTSRTTRTDQILNKDSKEIECKFIFKIDELKYVIHRKGKLEYSHVSKSDRVKCNVDFYRFNKDGNKESLNGESRYDTNANIKKYIGDYDDIVSTLISIQNDHMGIIDLKTNEKTSFLIRILRLNIFDKLHEIANEDYKDLRYKIKNIDKNDLIEKLNSYKNKLESNKNDKKGIIKRRDKYKKRKKRINKYINNKHKNVVDVKDEFKLDIDDINEERDGYIYSLSQYEKQLGMLISKDEELEDNIKEIKNKILNLDIEELKERYVKYKNNKNKCDKLTDDISKLKIEFDNKLSKTKKLRNLEYDPDCEYCMNNIFVKDAIKTKKEIKKDSIYIKSIINKINTLRDHLSENKDVDEKYNDLVHIKDDLRDFKNDKIRNDNNILKIKQKMDEIDDNIKECDNRIDVYNKNKENINNNNRIYKDIDRLKDIRKKSSVKLNDIESTLSNIVSNIKYYNKEVIRYNKKIDKIIELKNKYKIYELYIECIRKRGLPYYIIEKVIPVIENKANEILSLLNKFTIEIGKEKLNIFIKYDGKPKWNISMGSGFEKFITSISLRTALMYISNLPKPNFIFIDEGFGNLDVNNLNNLGMVFNYLKDLYEKIIIITHLDTIKSEVDNILNVTIDNGHSTISK